MGKIVDVSKWQGDIDFSKAKDELDLIILRASARNTTDIKLEHNANNCIKHKIPFGVYHFTYATNEDEAVKEENTFFSSASKYNPLFYVVDIEDSSIPNKAGAIVAKTFAECMRSHGVSFFGMYIANHRYASFKIDTSLADFIWVPNYNEKPIYSCDLWQYTSKGSLAGVSGNVDLNYLNGDRPLEWFTLGNFCQYKQLKDQECVSRGSTRKSRVKWIQWHLMRLGYYLGGSVTKSIDGKFGPLTDAAVRAFQTKEEIEIDGIVGPITKEHLIKCQ